MNKMNEFDLSLIKSLYNNAQWTHEKDFYCFHYLDLVPKMKKNPHIFEIMKEICMRNPKEKIAHWIEVKGNKALVTSRGPDELPKTGFVKIASVYSSYEGTFFNLDKLNEDKPKNGDFKSNII
jgi:hypothetical protein